MDLFCKLMQHNILYKMGYDVEVIDYYPERLHLIGMLKELKTEANY